LTEAVFGEFRPFEGATRDEDYRGPRLPTQRDSDRILYSSAFRRLSGVTQVVSPQDDFVYHDRLQHSLKVAQVAHRLGQALLKEGKPRNLAEKLDPDAAHAASLAHDLGHPPFGHAAEEELCALLQGKIDKEGKALVSKGGQATKNKGVKTAGSNATEATENAAILKDGFDGNAQAFRIVAKIGFRKSDEHDFGLNLSWRTLAGVLKYPWLWSEGKKKWGAYNSEKVLMEETIERAKAKGVFGTRSIEAEIMDWADDVAYAVHDIEDFYRAGLIPLNRLKRSFNDWRDAKTALRTIMSERGFEVTSSEFERQAFAIRVNLPQEPYIGSKLNRFQLHKFASEQIRVMTSLSAAKLGGEGILNIARTVRVRCEILKSLTWHYVIYDPSTFVDQAGQKRVVRELFTAIHAMTEDAWLSAKSASARQGLPARLNDYCEFALTDPGMGSDLSDSKRLARATTDFITSLTDKQAGLLHRRLTGEPTDRSRLYWLRV
jgi:dGTPase